MKPIPFKEQTAIFAKGQPQYLPLPARLSNDESGEVTSCWKFSWRERLLVLFGARVYWHQLTYHRPLQPVKPVVGWEPDGEKKRPPKSTKVSP